MLTHFQRRIEIQIVGRLLLFITLFCREIRNNLAETIEAAFNRFDGWSRRTTRSAVCQRAVALRCGAHGPGAVPGRNKYINSIRPQPKGLEC